MAKKGLQEERKKGCRKDSRFGYNQQRINKERLYNWSQHKWQGSHKGSNQKKKMINCIFIQLIPAIFLYIWEIMICKCIFVRNKVYKE